MRITDYLTPERIAPDLSSSDKEGVLGELAQVLVNNGDDLRDQVHQVLLERERLASTGIGHQVAIPHGKLDAIGTLMIGLGRSPKGVDYDSVDGLPAHLFFVLVAPSNSTAMHLKALARISRLCRDDDLRQQILDADDSETIYSILVEEDRKFG